MKGIAFNTANLVARVTDYRFELADWGEQHKKTSAATDASQWRAICREIAGAGYRAAEVWVAHVDPADHDAEQIARFQEIMDEHDIEPVGVAGGLSEATGQAAQWLDAGVVHGGLGNRSRSRRRSISATSGSAWRSTPAGSAVRGWTARPPSASSARACGTCTSRTSARPAATRPCRSAKGASICRASSGN